MKTENIQTPEESIKPAQTFGATGAASSEESAGPAAGSSAEPLMPKEHAKPAQNSGVAKASEQKAAEKHSDSAKAQAGPVQACPVGASEMSPALHSAAGSSLREPLRPSRRDLALAGLSYIAGYLYWKRGVYGENDARTVVLQIIFPLFMIFMAELRFRYVHRSKESNFWLLCLLLSSAGVVMQRSAVWDTGKQHFFQASLYVWWLLNRSGVLLDGKSSALLPADALNGFILIPFGHFGLRIRTLAGGLRQRFEKSEKRDLKSLPLLAAASVLVLILFAAAIELLKGADAGFERWMSGLLDLAFCDDWYDTITILLLSLPTGAWLHGLIAGAGCTAPEKLKKQRESILKELETVRRIPAGFWVFTIGVFTLLYMAFFAFQTKYLFSAFRGVLPDGFIVSEYARKGFFELCKLSCVNFALIWLAMRMTVPGEKGQKAVGIAAALMLAETIVFCGIALSKLILYIDIFGFTSKRLESCWLICVIFGGCDAWLYRLYAKRPAFRGWLLFSALTLSLLCLW